MKQNKTNDRNNKINGKITTTNGTKYVDGIHRRRMRD
jgi:hypothetical protein